MSKAEPIRVGHVDIDPGAEKRLELRVARMLTGSWLSLPVVALNGVEAGPRIWLSAALHGDELNGLEIIRRVLQALDPLRLRGSIVAVPIVNVFGFEEQDRYLPDRRDLNRSFPGSPRGSLAARLAHLFVTEIMAPCQYGIDLHTGSHHRANLPQVRADLVDPETRRIAVAFGAPMMYDAPTISGSLRAVARQRGIHVLVYEAGEPLRFNAEAISTGVDGVLRVLQALGMIAAAPPASDAPVFEARERRWIRASRSGIFHLAVELGQEIERRGLLGELGDPLLNSRRPVRSSFAGMVIGFTRNPLVHQGDALVHLAKL